MRRFREMFLYWKDLCRTFGFRGPGGRVENSRSRGPKFESRHWTNFQRLWRINVNGELRGKCDFTMSLYAISKAQICKSGAVSNDQWGNCEVVREAPA